MNIFCCSAKGFTAFDANRLLARDVFVPKESS